MIIGFVCAYILYFMDLIESGQQTETLAKTEARVSYQFCFVDKINMKIDQVIRLFWAIACYSMLSIL